MNKQNNCEYIRSVIEEYAMDITGTDRNMIDDHIISCDECYGYLAELERLKPVRKFKYTMPDQLRMNFSAQVRTRIEEKKYRRKHRGFILRPAFQLTVMLVVLFSVTIYLFNTTGPGQLYVFHEDDFDFVAPSSVFYNDYFIPDDAAITHLYSGMFFEESNYFDDLLYPGFPEYEYYNDLDNMSPEEIDYLIQRLEEV